MPVQLGAPPQHGFDEPLGLLSDCHRRIENFLGILQKIARLPSAPLDQSQRDAVRASLTYFRTAAPRHNQDEEHSLFPLMRSSSQPQVRVALNAIQSLEADHADATPKHEAIDRLFNQWLDSGSLSADQKFTLESLLDDLGQMYKAHIEIEDTRIFPLAADVLTHEQLVRLGSEMAKRRGLNAAQHPRTQFEGNAQMSTKSTIDVRTIPGPERHPLIFKTFDSLEPGEALELLNDHDPFPLQNQFNFMKRGQFSWDYLQQGPDLWRVRISKVQPGKAQPPRS